MKYYKSFILFSLFALAFVSCNTDDLERDIDALKDRVTNVEAQVQQLNDEMNIIRVLLDGNKTITDYSINGDTYTLTSVSYTHLDVYKRQGIFLWLYLGNSETL